MKTTKVILLMLLIFLSGLEMQAQQTKRTSTTQKSYPFNPDYPDFYYGKERVFLEFVYYQRNADISKTIKSRYMIKFSGMTRKLDGTKKYIASNWGFRTLEEFTYYKDLIENKKYYRILLSEAKDSSLECNILVQMHPKRAIPKL